MKHRIADHRKEIDDQLSRLPTELCDLLIDASVRRLIRVRGPIETATKLQRIADDLACLQLMPIEHWRNAGKPQPAAKSISTVKGWARLICSGLFCDPVITFWIGFATAAYWFA